MSNQWLKQALDKKKKLVQEKTGGKNTSSSKGNSEGKNQVTSNRPSKKAAGRGR